MTSPPQNIRRRGFPWRRSVLIVTSGVLSYLLIPWGFSNYNEVRLLREARQARAIKFSDRNADFNSKVNGLVTLMESFADHNYRLKISGLELKEERKELLMKYRERYLEIDATLWWWPWEFEREARALRLLSPDEVNQLKAHVTEYSGSVLETTNEVKRLWTFLDSPQYRVDEQSMNKAVALKASVLSEVKKQYELRNVLVEKISALFSQSEFRSGWSDIAGFR